MCDAATPVPFEFTTLSMKWESQLRCIKLRLDRGLFIWGRTLV